jgi:hypothetical protein
MGMSALRGMVTGVLLVLFPFSLFAADSDAAMLYTSGHAWVNGGHVPRSSSAIFSGDLLQTHSDSIANINQPGSTVQVLSESLVQFEGSSVKIDHGAVRVSTSKLMATTAGDVKVVPVSSVWTEFNVTDVDGTVRISARKGDLTISDGKETTTLAQGQETRATNRLTLPLARAVRIRNKRLEPPPAPLAEFSTHLMQLESAAVPL